MSYVSFPGGASVPLGQIYGPQPIFVHPTIDPDIFSLDIVANTLHKNEVFEVAHLSTALVQVAMKDMRSKLNNYQIQTLQTPIPNCLNDDAALTVLLNQWFNIFDSAFFGGQLSGGTLGLKVSRGIISNDPQYASNPNRLAGIYWSGKGYVEVNLDTDFSGIGFLGDQEHMHIITLLHEMIHAFLDIFGCKCGPCNTKIDAKMGGYGWRGHGPSWANAAHYTAQALAAQTLWPIHMNVDISVRVEMQYSNWKPTITEARLWNLTGIQNWQPLVRELWRTWNVPAPQPVQQQPIQPVQPPYIPPAPAAVQAADQRLRGAFPIPKKPVAGPSEDDDAIEARNVQLISAIIKWNQDHAQDCGTNPTIPGQSSIGGQTGVGTRGPAENGAAREAANTERMQRRMGGF